MNPILLGRPGFAQRIQETLGGPLKARAVDILQVNLGYRCNMACKHCHVLGGPARTESMAPDTVEAVIAVLRNERIGTLDLTGGAPELHPGFRRLVRDVRALERHVIVRSNLTVFFEPGMEDLPDLYADQGVECIASLPFYQAENVDRVRGLGTYEKSILALQQLNRLGYGEDHSGLKLNLVFNPQGAFLPPTQSDLEAEYKRVLQATAGIRFNKLYTFTNMPIGRFREFLVRSSNEGKYLARLADAFNPATLENVMCRSLVSVDWQGHLYDCDFNQVAGLPVTPETPQHIRDFDHGRLASRSITVADHCYGCTAGQGSS